MYRMGVFFLGVWGFGTCFFFFAFAFANSQGRRLALFSLS